MSHEAARIKVTINGESREIEGGSTVRELIETLGLNRESVAVERNRSIVKKDSFDAARIEDGDQLEIVEFVGGG